MKRLVGVDDLVGPEIFLRPGHRHGGQQVQDGVARHAHQNIVALGGEHPSPAHDEEVGAAAFGNEALIVGQQREGMGVHPVGLQVGHLVVEAASVLDLGIDQVSRHRSLGDDHRVDPRAVEGAVAGQVPPQGPAVDGDGGFNGASEHAPVHGEGPSGDVVHDLDIGPVHDGQVSFQGLQGGPLHLLDGQAAIDLQVLEPGINALQMLLEPEGLLAVGPGHVEHHVPEHEGRIENGDPSLLLADKLSVEVNRSAGHVDFLESPGPSGEAV